MKCEKCGWDDKGTGDFAHVCGPVEVKKQGVMNERIRELMDQCWEEREIENGLVHRYINQEKFAELIVRECIGCCDEVDRLNQAYIEEYCVDQENGPKECIQVIKAHFGVEE